MPQYTVEEALRVIGFGWRQWALCFACGLYWSADSLQMMFSAYFLPLVKVEFGLTQTEVNVTASVVFLGIAIGTYLAGMSSDKFGRKVTYAVTACLTGVFGIATSFARTLPQLLALRTCLGIALGGAPSSFAYFAEFLSINHRGSTMVWFELFWTFGTIFEALLAYFILEPMGWRWLLFFSSIPIMLLVLVVPLLPGSPRFFVARGDVARADAILHSLAASNKKQLPGDGLAAPPRSGSGARAAPKRFGATLLALFSPAYFLTTILLWFIWMTNSFVYYGLVLFSQSYFETIAQNALLVTLITSAAELPGVLLVVLLIDRAGRRRTQAICFFVCGLTTLLLLIPHLPEKIIVLFSVVSRACIFGAYATSYVFSTEAYPSEIRGTGLAAAAALAKVASIVTPFVAYSNPTIPLAVYGGCAIIASAASMALPFDTAGGQLKDFVDETPGNDATAAADGDKHATTASGAGSGERQPLLE